MTDGVLLRKQTFKFELQRKKQFILFLSNSKNLGTKMYSLTQCSLTVNECDWHILADNDERIDLHFKAIV